MKLLNYGIPTGISWDEYLKNSKPLTREEILEYARKEESTFKLGRIVGWAVLVLGLFLMFMPINFRILGTMTVLVGFVALCYAHLFAQICFASIQRMWERCDDQDAELRKSIAQDL